MWAIQMTLFDKLVVIRGYLDHKDVVFSYTCLSDPCVLSVNEEREQFKS